MKRELATPISTAEVERDSDVRLVPIVPHLDALQVFELVDDDPDHIRSFDLGSGYYSTLASTYSYLKEWSSKGSAFTIMASEQMCGNVYISEQKEPEIATLSYWVAKRYTRQGTGTEAVRQAIDFAFTNLDKAGLMAGVALTNEPSIALLKKVGFVQIQKHTLDMQGGPVDIGVFGLMNPNLDVETL